MIRLSYTLDPGSAERLRRLAASRGVGAGQVARALVVHGLDHLHDDEVRAAVDREVTADRARRSAVGRSVMAARHDKQEP